MVNWCINLHKKTLSNIHSYVQTYKLKYVHFAKAFINFTIKPLFCDCLYESVWLEIKISVNLIEIIYKI